MDFTRHNTQVNYLCRVRVPITSYIRVKFLGEPKYKLYLVAVSKSIVIIIHCFTRKEYTPIREGKRQEFGEET